jgi:integrase
MTSILSSPIAPGKEESEMGSIYRRGKTYWIKYYRNGKPYYESSRSDKQEVARKFLKMREGEISQGKLPGIYFDRVRFDELAKDYLTDYRINQKKSLEKAEICARYLTKEFGGMKVPDITTPRIKLYIEKRMDEGAANATINRELSALKRMLNLAARCTPPKVAHIPYIPMLIERNARKGFFEHSEFMALRDALPYPLKPLVTFAYKTGWRKNEILNLTWDRVDLQEGVVRLDIGQTKNDEARTVYLDSELKTLLKELLAKRRLGCEYVFHRKGKKIKCFRKSWLRACKVVGLGNRIFHDFRRTAVRNIVRAGVPERVAMMVSGHKTRSVFDRYNIVNTDDLKQAAVKQEDYLNGLDQKKKLQNGYNPRVLHRKSTSESLLSG